MHAIDMAVTSDVQATALIIMFMLGVAFWGVGRAQEYSTTGGFGLWLGRVLMAIPLFYLVCTALFG